MEQNLPKTTKIGKVLRIGGLVAVIGLILLAIMASMNPGKPSHADKVWYEEMTLGNLEAENYFVVYSDVACPYCIAFENALIEHHEDLERYLEENDILLEVRLADFLYQYGETKPVQSREAAVATHCARKQGKFWDYYDRVVTRVWREYFNRGKEAYTEFSKVGRDYWLEIGEEVGLGEDFVACVEGEETVEAVKADAQKMTRIVSGMPYFKFNDYVLSGFDLSWGWEYVLMYFEAGLKS